MEASGLWEDSVIVFTGDHGEEFYENGHLFHASELSPQQILVPLYFKFGKLPLPKEPIHSCLSHIDIFPTLLHYLFGETTLLEPLFDGESLFNPKKRSYSVIGRYNGSRSPYEFLIYDGEKQLQASFGHAREIFNANILQIIHSDGQNNPSSFQDIFSHNLDPLLFEQP